MMQRNAIFSPEIRRDRIHHTFLRSLINCPNWRDLLLDSHLPLNNHLIAAVNAPFIITLIYASRVNRCLSLPLSLSVYAYPLSFRRIVHLTAVPRRRTSPCSFSREFAHRSLIMERKFRGKEQSPGHYRRPVFGRKAEDVGAPNSEC